MSNPLTPETRRSCDLRLGEIGNPEIQQLREFAEYRLAGIGRPIAEGEDLVSSALAAVVQGLESEQLGRRPRPEDVLDKGAFMFYLQGIIISLISSESKSKRVRAQHQPLDMGGTDLGECKRGVVIVAPNQNPAEEAAWNDLRQQIFSRLHERVRSRLRPTLEAWEPTAAFTDKIPNVTYRKYVVELRKLAQEVAHEIGVK